MGHTWDTRGTHVRPACVSRVCPAPFASSHMRVDSFYTDTRQFNCWPGLCLAQIIYSCDGILQKQIQNNSVSNKTGYQEGVTARQKFSLLDSPTLTTARRRQRAAARRWWRRLAGATQNQPPPCSTDKHQQKQANTYIYTQSAVAWSIAFLIQPSVSLTFG